MTQLDLNPIENSTCRCHGAPDARHRLATRLQKLRRRHRQELTEAQKATEQMRHEALHDALTDLPNRALLMDRLERCVARAAQNAGHTFAVLFLDIDDFKLINDGFSHEIGDAVLLEVARRLIQTVRDADTIVRAPNEQPAAPAEHPMSCGASRLTARLGGDEFVVLLEQISSVEAALAVASRLQASMRRPMNVKGRELTVTASLGIAFARDGALSAAELLSHADAALYRSKAAGKGQFSVFDAELHSSLTRAITLESRLLHAKAEGELELHYQPIIRVADGGLHGFEALLRWRQRDGRLMMPDQFLPAAEQSGAIHEIGRWVMEEAARQLVCWNAQRSAEAALRVSMNVATRQLERWGGSGLSRHGGDFLGRFKELGAKPGWLTVEIKESAFHRRREGASAVIAEMRKAGVQVVLDNFGVGTASLTTLASAPVDAVKISRSLFIGASPGPDVRSANWGQDLSIVRAVSQMAHATGKVVAIEGVETARHFEALQGIRADYAQGYLIARPMSAEAAGRFLQLTPRWRIPA